MQSRREFIKMTGLALGGVILSSCGSSSGPSGRPVPNGFQFYRLINRGDALPGGTTITDLPGSAMISSANTVFFHAKDSAGAMGCYELSVDYGGIRPVVTGIRKVVRDGDLLPDGRTVAKVTGGDVNRAGSYASVLKLTDGNVTGLYLDPDRKGMQRVVGYQDASPGVDGFIGQRIGDVDLHDNNDILFTAHFGNHKKGRPQVGLFHLPAAGVGSNARLVATSDELVSGADGILKSFGLIDMNDGGYYVTQAVVELHKATGTAVTASTRPVQATALLSGHIADARPQAVVAASATMAVSKAAQAISGEIIMGPRLGSSYNIAHVVHTSDDDMALYYENRRVIASGDSSPRGRSIWSISPAVVGDDGLLYFSLVTDTGAELCIYNGSFVSSILGSGDIMPNDNYAVISRVLFGTMNTQVDRQGRITFIGEYTSATSQVDAVVVGLPV